MEPAGGKTVVGPGNPKADFNTNTLYDLWELLYFGDMGADPDAEFALMDHIFGGRNGFTA